MDDSDDDIIEILEHPAAPKPAPKSAPTSAAPTSAAKPAAAAPLKPAAPAPAAAPAAPAALPASPLDTPVWSYDPSASEAALAARAGQPLPFLLLSRAFAALEHITSRNRITGVLVNMFRGVLAAAPQDTAIVLALCGGAVTPDGIGGALLTAAVCEATGASREAVSRLYKELGDVGDVAARLQRGQSVLKASAPLSVRGVHDALGAFGGMTGAGATAKRQAAMVRLLRACRESEIRYVTRLLASNLRTGASTTTAVQALARAAALEEWLGGQAGAASGSSGKSSDGGKGNGGAKKRPRGATDDAGDVSELPPAAAAAMAAAAEAAKHAFAACPDLNRFVATLLARGDGSKGVVARLTSGIGATPGRAVQPMLARITNGIPEVLTRFAGCAVTAEYKYDGQRAQIHVYPKGEGGSSGTGGGAGAPPAGASSGGSRTPSRSSGGSGGSSTLLQMWGKKPTATAGASSSSASKKKDEGDEEVTVVEGAAAASSSSAPPSQCDASSAAAAEAAPAAAAREAPSTTAGSTLTRTHGATVFSRHLDDTTQRWPDAVEAVLEAAATAAAVASADTSAPAPPPRFSFILDAELVAVQPPSAASSSSAAAAGGAHPDLRILPFQTLSTRARQASTASEVTVSVCVVAFDLLCWDGVSLLHLPLATRRAMLFTHFVHVPLRFTFAAHLDVTIPRAVGAAAAAEGKKDEEGVVALEDGESEAAGGGVGSDGSGAVGASLTAFLHEALNACCEGLMIKLLKAPTSDVNGSDSSSGGGSEAGQPSKAKRAKGITGATASSSSSSSSSSLVATYQPSIRSNSWLKVKRDYVEGLAESFDLVVIGAWYGNGRKAGWFSPFLLAAYKPEGGEEGEEEGPELLLGELGSEDDGEWEEEEEEEEEPEADEEAAGGEGEGQPAATAAAAAPAEAADAAPPALPAAPLPRGKWQSVCRLMSGMSDAFYREATAFFSAPENRLDEATARRVYDTGERPPLWFRPVRVWEIRGADLTLSPVHAAGRGRLHPSRGISLRFPRLLRDRTGDKGPEDATTGGDLAQAYARQSRKL